MKRVLIITYYWPPGGGSGVQRWLKFVKYLPQTGWQPIVYTPENGEMPVNDASLTDDIPADTEVLKTKIWEPYNLYKTFIGADKNVKVSTGFLTEEKKPGMAEKLSVWLRGNIFIPDARRFWIGPSIKYLSSYLEKSQVDAIVSTGPPHSMHLIAMKLSEKFNIPWVADFRDPWTKIDYFGELMLTQLAEKKHYQLEREVITRATRVVVVGNTMKKEFEQEYKRHVDVITNGYDSDDVKAHTIPSTGKFSIAHVGTLVRSQNPVVLWNTLSEMARKDAAFKNDLEIRLTGKVDLEIRNSLKEAGLISNVTFIDYMPHNQVISEQQRAMLLLLVLKNSPQSMGILTGKLFEYLAAKRPILCVGPVEGDAAVVINETKSGTTVDFDNQKAMNQVMADFYSKFKTGNLTVNVGDVQKYSRKALTVTLANLLNEISH